MPAYFQSISQNVNVNSWLGTENFPVEGYPHTLADYLFPFI